MAPIGRDYSDIVCFILPIQFRRYNVHKRIREDAKLIYELIEKDYDKYDRIIFHTISSGISCTIDTMKMVIKEVDKDSKVFLLDAKLVSYGG